MNASTPPPAPLGEYRADIDALRAVAVLPVLLFHAGAPGFSGGFVGVDVFFVISGFLITGLIAGEAARGAFSFTRFYERRARRLFPALFVVLTATALASSALLLPGDLQAFARSLFATQAFGSNFLFWQESGYFDVRAHLKPLLHTWSLGVEEQFYLVFPAVLLLGRRALRRHWRLALAAGAVASLGLSVYLTTKSPAVAFYLLPARAWELLLGGLLAVYPLPRPPRLAWPLGLLLIGAAVVLYSDATPFPGLAAILPTTGAALFVWGRPRSVPPAVAYVGRLSYSLYLWHWPVLVLAHYAKIGPLGPWERAGCLALAGVLASISFHLVEQPVRRRQVLASTKALWSGYAVSTAALVLAGLVLLTGLPSRLTPRALALDALTSPPAGLCARECAIGAPGVPTVLVWGDSHAAAFGPVYDAALRSAGLSGLLVTRDGCPPLIGVSRPRYGAPCLELAQIEAARFGRFRTVVLVSHWGGYSGLISDGAAGEPLNRSIARTVLAVRRAGARPVVSDPVPGALLPVAHTLALEAYYGRRVALERPTADYRAQAYFRTPPPAETISFADLCGPAFCAAERQGEPLYWDAHHINARAWAFAVPRVEAALASGH